MKKKDLRKKEVLWRQQEILSGAKSVFLRKGFHKVTMDDIARQTGLSKGALYLYFPSKEKLFMALMEHSVEARVKLTEEILKSKESSLNKIRNYVYSTLDYFQKDRDLIMIMMMIERDALCAGLHKGIHEKAMQMMIKITQYITNVMKEGIKEGSLRKRDPYKMALALAGMVQMFVMHALFYDIKLSPDQYTEFITETFLEGVKK